MLAPAQKIILSTRGRTTRVSHTFAPTAASCHVVYMILLAHRGSNMRPPGQDWQAGAVMHECPHRCCLGGLQLALPVNAQSGAFRPFIGHDVNVLQPPELKPKTILEFYKKQYSAFAPNHLFAGDTRKA